MEREELDDKDYERFPDLMAEYERLLAEYEETHNDIAIELPKYTFNIEE